MTVTSKIAKARSAQAARDDALHVLLVERDLVASDVLDELRAIQRDAWQPFGRIAVKLGLLRITQLAKVLALQATDKSKTFGECARSLGLLARADIETILEHQRSSVPTLSQLLVEEMVLSRAELEAVLDELKPRFAVGS